MKIMKTKMKMMKYMKKLKEKLENTNFMIVKIILKKILVIAEKQLKKPPISKKLHKKYKIKIKKTYLNKNNYLLT